MNVSQAIHARRAYRSLAPVEVGRELAEDLARHAQLSASCFNNQPWRFVFVYHPPTLQKVFQALNPGNAWARKASMVVVPLSREEDDCVIGKRRYHLFDLGMAVATLILRATELGLVAHPIAGFKPSRVRKALGIPRDYTLLTLVMVGRHSPELEPSLSPDQVEAEKTRPPRKPLEEFVYHNYFPSKTMEDLD